MTAGAGSGSGGRREAGDFESRPEKETTTQPEKVGERAPSMPAPGSDGDWDSLKTVEFGSAYSPEGSDGGFSSEARTCSKGEYRYSQEGPNARHVYGQLRYVPVEERVRDGKAQKEAGGNDRRSTDDGGHIIGSRFGGLSIPENLFPQDANFNRGDYQRLEKEWQKQLEDRNRVYVDIHVSSAGGGREDAIYGSYLVERPDGSFYTEWFSFANESRHEKEQWNEISDEVYGGQ